MVFDKEQLKPFILHNDPLVRSGVVEYFEEGRIWDADIVPLVLEAFERYPNDDPKYEIMYASHQPLDEESLETILELLKKEKCENRESHLRNLLLGMPIELFEARQSDLKKNGNVGRRITDYHDHRLRFSKMDGDSLWNELQRYAEWANESAYYTTEIDSLYVDALIEALARHDKPEAESFLNLLKSDEVVESWLEIFLIDLAGMRKLSSAVPYLVYLYREDEDYMLERVTRALVEIGDPEAVRLIRERFVDENWGFQNYASGLLGNFKHPDCEEALLALRDKRGLTYEYFERLCFELCRQFHPAAVAWGRELIETGIPSDFFNVEEELIVVATIHGIELPEADRWREELAAGMMDERRRQARLQSLLPTPPPSASSKKKIAELFPGWSDSPKSPERSPASDAGKIGRNEPCPCGSGKKYKKCCGHPSGRNL